MAGQRTRGFCTVVRRWYEQKEPKQGSDPNVRTSYNKFESCCGGKSGLQLCAPRLREKWNAKSLSVLTSEEKSGHRGLKRVVVVSCEKHPTSPYKVYTVHPQPFLPRSSRFEVWVRKPLMTPVFLCSILHDPLFHTDRRPRSCKFEVGSSRPT